LVSFMRIILVTFTNQPQEVPVVDFIQPAGFADAYEQDLVSNAQTIFIARPSAEAGHHCSYLLSDDSKRLYLPNTVRCFLNHAEIISVKYEDSMYGTQEKLLMHFTSIGGDPFVWRVGALSYASSSLVLGLTHLNSTALTGQVEITWVSKGAAVFARVASAVNDGFVPVNLPKEALGYKLSMDELLDGLTFINKSIQSGDAIPPRFFSEAAEPEQEVEPVELDSVLSQIRKPSAKPRTRSRKTEVSPA